MIKEKEKKETHLTTKVYWEIEVRDKSGKIIESKQVEARSWLRQFIAILKGLCGYDIDTGTGVGNVSVVDETGSARTFPRGSSGWNNGFGCLGQAGNVNEGIVVGSSDTSNTLTTYALGSKIPHGSSANQLLYQTTTVEDVTNPSGNDLQFRIIRAFVNNSGSTVTVKEIGLLCRYTDSGNNNRNGLLARDVLPSPIDIPDGATLTIRYIVRITVG